MMFDEIRRMREKFGLSNPNSLFTEFDDVDFLDFRIALIDEEVAELKEALSHHDIVEIADALVDLSVVTMGFAAGLGINFNACWDEIMKSNMSKERGDARDTKRGHKFDLVKGSNYHAPNLEKIIRARTSRDYRLGVFAEATFLRKKKEDDYQGQSFSRDDYFLYGFQSYIQMLWIKMLRIRALSENKKEPNNESIRDSLLDMINYASFLIEAIDGEGV